MEVELHKIYCHGNDFSNCGAALKLFVCVQNNDE